MKNEVIIENVELKHAYVDNTGALIQRTGWPNYEGISLSFTGPDILTPATLELTFEQVDMLRDLLNADVSD